MALGRRAAQQLPVAANPQGTCAFAAGANEGVSSVVDSGLIVMVSPALPLLLYVLVEASDACAATPSPAASTAATPTPAAIGLMALYISAPPNIHRN
jgi:hypothetical protein